MYLKRETLLRPKKVHIVKAMAFSVVMYGCESGTIQKAEHWKTDAFKLVVEKTLESPLDSKEIKPFNSKGNWPWIFIGRTDAEAPILWPPDMKSWLTGKDPDAGKDCGHAEKGATEGEMVGWHHLLNGRESEQIPGDSKGQRSLACCSLLGCKESDTAEHHLLKSV